MNAPLRYPLPTIPIAERGFSNTPTFGILSTYPPTVCGLATFSRALADGLAANGADVTVDRTVTKDGATYFQDQFQTHYEAWQAVCEYAPGTADPEKKAKRQTPPLCQAPRG